MDEVSMEFINQWLAHMEIAPILGAALIAAADRYRGELIQLLGDKPHWPCLGGPSWEYGPNFSILSAILYG